MNKVYGESARPHRTVARWVILFSADKKNIQDDPRSWKASASVLERDVATVKILVEKDVQYTIEVFSNISSLNSSAMFSILKERRRLKKDYALWLSLLLLTEQKKDRVKKASQLLALFKGKDPSDRDLI